ncbi:ACT domain-containing protein [Cellulomonas hominis]
MTPERDLAILLATMTPVRVPGEFVFATVPLDAPTPSDALATVVEPVGRSVVLPRTSADRDGIRYDFVGAWITLQVTSALDAVGLTAAVSARLAELGVSCNVIAGHHHDHLLVPADRADDVVAALVALSADVPDGPEGSAGPEGPDTRAGW